MCFAKSWQFCFSYFQLRMFKSILNQCSHQKFTKSLKESYDMNHTLPIPVTYVTWFIYKNTVASFNKKYNLYIQKKTEVPLPTLFCSSAIYVYCQKTCNLCVLSKCNNYLLINLQMFLYSKLLVPSF